MVLYFFFVLVWLSVFRINTSCSILGVKVLMLQFQAPIPIRYRSHGIWPFRVGRSLTAWQWVLEGAFLAVPSFSGLNRYRELSLSLSLLFYLIY